MREPKDIERASFQYAGNLALFRHRQTAQGQEYIWEDFQGNVVESLLDSTISFHSFVEQGVKKVMDGLA